MANQKKKVEDTYKKLTQREHVLERPGMYIGSIKKQTEELWVAEKGESGYQMKKKMIQYTPGFIKIFDEILTNATDHSFRDPTVTTIKVDFDKTTGEISVYNNGTGIPVQVHTEHGIYVPELIFGHLLSGSNYDDTVVRTGAGTNGIGSNCVNIYSKKFIVETLDSDQKKKFVQEYTDNMTKRTKAKITTNSGKSYTKITFVPDYPRFEMDHLDDDTVLLLQKRVLDCIACTNDHVQVYLNNEKLKGKGLVDYTKYYFDEKVIHEAHTEKIKSKNGEVTEYVWEYAVVPYTHYEQVSFVNGNATTQGGKHVDYILYQIINKLKKILEDKKKLKDLKPNFIKDRFFFFLRSTVANPSFNSQTKEQLTTPSKDFGCTITVTDNFMTKLYKSSITDELVEFCKVRESVSLSKQTDGSKKSKVYIPKLEDALWAGTARSNQCTLILTEGDSAKTFAMWGRSVVGPEKYGVMPLKGKCNSWDTKIPLWNGEIKLAKDIDIGDIVIGDDGNPRTVLTLYKGYGKMYEISQDRGESYKVNDEHILTLCMPEHKRIYWVPSNYTWRTIYWDKKEKKIIRKESQASIKVKCKECGVMINTKSVKRHYTRKHKNVEYIPYELENKDKHDIEVIKARTILEEFLSNVDDNNIIDINIQDYLNIPKGHQRKLKGIRGQCVNWEYKEVTLDPYVLGLWLGDGMKSGYANPSDGIEDFHLIEYLSNWGNDNDAKFTESTHRRFTYSISSIQNYKKKGYAPLRGFLSQYNLINNKHIPKEYLINSKEIRLKVLAGIIDTDGHVFENGRIEICQSTKHKALVDDIVYLSRSLGFYTHVSDKKTNYYYRESGQKANAYRIMVSGDTSIIPTLLQRKQSRSTILYNIRSSTGTIKIKETDDGNYVGIGIDGNSRFLINDFTITHNCLNIRDATISQLINNEEINNLKQIIGLKQDKVYKDTSELRYGKVMLLTDSDVDGSHIKALLVNFFHYWWPSLIKLDYIQTLKTPIVKAIKGKQVVEFFTEQDYIKWKNSGVSLNGYQIRYFKGLGTSKKEDAKDTFKRLEELKVDYYYKDKRCDESILLAFDKDKNNKSTDKCTDKRKRWLSEYDRDVYLDMNQKRVSYQDLINKELIHFSIYDNLRSIPSLCDGLKPSQRKILYYMLKKSKTQLIKVAQLSGYVSAETAYHHGEASLQGAIINMAQRFVGSNNINLLYPDGNFGCLDPNTEILLWNGTFKKARDVIVGDKLIGDDGTIRTVLQTTSGVDTMYKITTNKNDSYTVNSKHILTLKFANNKVIQWKESGKYWRVSYFDTTKMKECHKSMSTCESSEHEHYNKSTLTKQEAHDKLKQFIDTVDSPDDGIIDIKVDDFLQLPSSTKSKFYSINNSSCIDWESKEVPINPYILGTWIGDGNSNGSGITTIDEEILREWVTYMDSINCELTHDKVDLENHDKLLQRKCNFLNDKHIPIEYIVNSKDVRLQLLAGIIDTDGTVTYDTTNNVPIVEICQSKRLRHHIIKSIEFLCNSLGFRTTVGEANLTKEGESTVLSVINIYGDNLDTIPTRVKRKQISSYSRVANAYINSFKVECVNNGQFNGWQLDGNERFLLNNFIITHNSRLQHGKDAASPRYIYTRLCDITQCIFNPNDTPLLNFLDDDGVSIEPEWYIPIIPMVLVNGCEGIGTGYSTYIPSFNPVDIINTLLQLIDKDDYKPLSLKPYFNGFNGIVEEVDKGMYVTKGKWERLSDKQIKITEIPVGMGVTIYKEFLESLIEGTSKTNKPKDKKKKFELKDVQNKTRDENDDILFIVEFKNAADLDHLVVSGELEKELKLVKSFTTNNMYLFNESLVLKKYQDPNDILLEFFEIRLRYYTLRRQHLISVLQEELEVLRAKARFIHEYITGDIQVHKKTMVQVHKQLEDRSYHKVDGAYDFLTRMQIASLTDEQITSLEQMIGKSQARLDDVRSKTDRDLWRDDLSELKTKLLQ